MDTRTEPIRQDIDSIRESMTGKMEQIEAQIKGTVADTTETLKRGLDVKYQVSEHPWAAVGVAVLAGYALGSMGSDSSPSTYRYREDFRYNDSRAGEQPRYYNTGSGNDSSANYSNPNTASHHTPNANYAYQGGQQAPSGGFLNDVLGQLGGELDTFKTAAISSLVSLLRDTVKQNLPGVYDEAERLRSDAQSYSGSPRSASGSSSSSSPSYGSSTASPGTGGTSSSASTINPGARSYQSGSSGSSSSGSGASGPSTGGSGEGEFYREADITEGNAPRYDRTTEMYPAGSSQPDQDPTSTQRDVGRNPNYDMIPPSPHANPDGRP